MLFFSSTSDQLSALLAFPSTFFSDLPSISFYLATFLIQVSLPHFKLMKQPFIFVSQLQEASDTSLPDQTCSTANLIIFYSFSPKKITLQICGVLHNPQSIFTLINLFDLHTKAGGWQNRYSHFHFVNQETKTWRGSDLPETMCIATTWGQESKSSLLIPSLEQFPLHSVQDQCKLPQC